MRTFILCCGHEKKNDPKCRTSKEEVSVCSSCSTKQAIQWYNYGYQDAKDGRRREFTLKGCGLTAKKASKKASRKRRHPK